MNTDDARRLTAYRARYQVRIRNIVQSKRIHINHTEHCHTLIRAQREFAAGSIASIDCRAAEPLTSFGCAATFVVASLHAAAAWRCRMLRTGDVVRQTQCKELRSPLNEIQQKVLAIVRVEKAKRSLGRNQGPQCFHVWSQINEITMNESNRARTQT